MSIFEDMAQFKALSRTVKIPLKGEGVALEFERSTPEEMSFAFRAATADSASSDGAGLDRGKFGMMLDRELWLLVRKKLVNWESLNGKEIPKFNKENAEAFCSCATFEVQREIVQAYSDLTQQLKEDAEKNEQTPVRASSKRSKSG